jgi:glucose/arabinose dehydrogenase
MRYFYLFSLLLASCFRVPPGEFKLEVLVQGLTNPLYLTSPVNDPRLFIVQQAGQILVFENGAVRSTPFLDISARINSTGNEQGLLSVAFHPSFAENGKFYVDYTDTNGDTVVSQFVVTQDPNIADPNSEAIILTQTQPFENHNGGLLKFGPDGFLYIGLGDGGSAGDPQRNGQNLDTLLGKLLRIDVDSAVPFAIPDNNPFANQANARGEIWHFGLRNPWRFSFDRETGDLYIGDVGQDKFEEIDFIAGGVGGVNWGWSAMEGNGHCFNDTNCTALGISTPITEYPHRDGCSVTGGYVYRGENIPALQGTYLYSDFCKGFIHGVKVENGIFVSDEDITAKFGIRDAGNVASFGEDAFGELYIVDLKGAIFKLAPNL